MRAYREDLFTVMPPPLPACECKESWQSPLCPIDTTYSGCPYAACNDAPRPWCVAASLPCQGLDFGNMFYCATHNVDRPRIGTGIIAALLKPLLTEEQLLAVSDIITQCYWILRQNFVNVVLYFCNVFGCE